MFYSLFLHTGMLPILHWVAAKSGVQESDPWRWLELQIAGQRAAAPSS
jgi:hypothetical protein